MGLRQDVLREIEREMAAAERERADAEKWRELDRELEELGYPAMAPADVVRLIVPREVRETLRDWLGPHGERREQLAHMPVIVAAELARQGTPWDDGNGHSGELGVVSETGPEMPCNGGYKGRRAFQGLRG